MHFQGLRERWHQAVEVAGFGRGESPSKRRQGIVEARRNNPRCPGLDGFDNPECHGLSG